MSRTDDGSAIVPGAPGHIDGDETAACADCPPAPAGNAAVFRVPDPRTQQPTVVPLCSYHLRALQREAPLRWHELREHPAVDGLESAAANEHVFVEFADLPDELPHAGSLYERLGLDEVGDAYFVTPTRDDVRVLRTDETLEDGEVTEIPQKELRGLLDHVDDRVGWRGIESGWISIATGWSQ